MNLQEYLSTVDMEPHRQTWCEYWLVSWRRLEKNLCTVGLFEAKDVRDLLWYEIRTRQRKHAILRLIQRYYRLEQTIGLAQAILIAANTKPQAIAALKVENGPCERKSLNGI